jgi:hypothetical protein
VPNRARRLLAVALLGAGLLIAEVGVMAATASGLTVAPDPRPFAATFTCPTPDPVPPPEPTEVPCA